MVGCACGLVSSLNAPQKASIWSSFAPLEKLRSAEGSAEDPEGDPEHARPRAGEDRHEPDGQAGGVLHRGRDGGAAATPPRRPGDGLGAVRLPAARTWGR